MKILAKVLALMIVAAALILQSCDKTGDNNPSADARLQFLGTWTCAETSGPTYPVSISEDASNSAQILIGNFHFLGAAEKVYAVATANGFTIPSQSLCGYTFNGSATVSSSTRVNVTYTANDQTDIVTVNAVYSK